MAKESIESSLIAALGQSKVFLASDLLDQYASSIHGKICPPLAVVRPVSELEVITLVRLANEFQFSIFSDFKR